MSNLQGKTALITGGAVGTRLADSFLNEGCSVALVYRDPSRKSGIESSFSRFESAFVAIRSDLSDPQQASDAVSGVKTRFGGVDFLLNSLGGWTGGKKLHEHSKTELEKMISIDLVPTFNIMRAVLPVMADQKFGRIVNFISMQVFGSGKGNSVYSASKSAILALTKAAAEEYKDSGIAVYAVAPSTIDTDNNRRSMPGADVRKWVSLDEIADAVKFLCSTGDSSNGTIIKFPGKL